MSYQNGNDRGSGANSQSHGTQSLIVLTNILKNIIVPLERQRTDNMMTTIKKFASNIDHTIQQVTGSISIMLPPKDDLPDKLAIKNKDLIIKYESLLVNHLIRGPMINLCLQNDWTQKIKDTLDAERKKKAEANYALGEIEFWRNKSATLSTLHQQLSLPIVNTVIERLRLYQEENARNLQYIQDFEENFRLLTNDYNEAKDNMKFLTTLERQFKNLALEGTDIEDLNIIEVRY